jgi:translation initiation factor 2B subunit (eIF-2B alpha/beta/delta family)
MIRPMSQDIRRIRADSLSGASELLESGADLLRRHAASSKARSLTAFVNSLAKASLDLSEAQPAMAPFLHLANAALRAAENSEGLAAARKEVPAAIAAFAAAAVAEREAAAHAASRFVRDGEVVLAYSRSSTVEEALLHAAAAGRRFTVLCPEARPAMEGRVLAARLAKARIPVTAIVDAAAFSMIPTVDVILVGADALVPVGLINKIGTSAMALVANAAEVPMYCVAGSLKMLPSAGLIDPHREGERLADEWDRCPAGVRILDRYYDLTRLDAITGFVTEEGLLSAEDLRARLRAIRLHKALKRAAPGRRLQR